MTPADALRVVNDEPVVIKHGRLYWSAGVIAALVAGGSSFMVTRATVDQHDKRIAKLEDATGNLATKADVNALSERIDRAIEAMYYREESKPRRKTP